MFAANSRYAHVATVEVTLPDGRVVTAVTLRPLPNEATEDHRVVGSDALDVMALRRFGDGTTYWRIADANTEIEAAELVREPARVIQVPVV